MQSKGGGETRRKKRKNAKRTMPAHPPRPVPPMRPPWKKKKNYPFLGPYNIKTPRRRIRIKTG